MKPDQLKELAQLIQLLRESPEIGSIEVRGWFGRGMVVTRNSLGGVGGGGGRAAPASPAAGVAPAPIAEGGEGSRPAAPPAPTHKEIKSPMVGTFYSAPEPGAEAYVKVGARVSPGQTVCIIEAMKIMNEIEAEFGGVVREILVENAQPVEFGQVLFRVDANV
ncbi:MAG TPA: acetyl-CoA carboxylase biotin carboxyl carrier protein [Gemmatimonadales bacterium]|nr:acetyl-CoA carboxylase biotin carboxyl carrier protein [Gemmatimonadales bacterium]